MIFRRKNKKVSVKQMQKWLNINRIEKVVELLQTGDIETRLQAIELLAKINLIQVKNALLLCLQDQQKEVALKAATSIEIMGATPDERERIRACREKWQAQGE